MRRRKAASDDEAEVYSPAPALSDEEDLSETEIVEGEEGGEYEDGEQEFDDLPEVKSAPSGPRPQPQQGAPKQATTQRASQDPSAVQPANAYEDEANGSGALSAG